MRCMPLLMIPASFALCAQAPKENLESQFARNTFTQVLDAVNDAWFGKPYQGANAVDIQGTLSIALSAQALNAKVDQLSQGQVKGGLTKGGAVSLKLKGTYFANGDFKTEMNGDFGNLLYTRVGNRGFLYSKEQNTYTTKVDQPALDAPLSFMGWFRQTLNDIKSVYAEGSIFKASLGKEEAAGGRSLQTLTFSAPTSTYDPKKREQSLAESLGFWKRGRLEVTFDKASKLPQRMSFSNDAQGVRSQMEFAYGGDGKLQSVSLSNQSKGMEGPGSLRLTYGGDGLISHLSGELDSQNKKVAFDLDLTWPKGKKAADIHSVPPPGATKKGRDEMETMLLVSLAGEILELQHNGLNLRSVTLANK